MFSIQLTDTHTAYVDDGDAEMVRCFSWYLHSEGYAIRNVPAQKRGGLPRMEYLHHFIVEPPPGHQVRFKDGNKLNCCRSNLEILSHSDARRAARPRKNGSSKYKGVSFHKKGKKWIANIRLDGKPRYLGSFSSEEAAARAYDAAARVNFGRVAYLNFPDATPAGPAANGYAAG